MRKKYLSALLFGALLFASAGTFTSCKDYDDDIDNLQSQITDVKNAVTELQKKIADLKFVSNVTSEGNGLKITWNDGTSTTINNVINDKMPEIPTPGDVITFDAETGEIIVNGKGSGYFAAKDSETAEVKLPYVNENGFLVLIDKDGNELVTNITVAPVSAIKNADGSYTITILCNGEKQEVVVPSAASSVTDLDIVGYTKPATFATSESLSSFGSKENGFYPASKGYVAVYAYKPNATSDWKGNKGNLPGGQILAAYKTNGLVVRVAPVAVDASSLEFSVVNSKSAAAPISVSMSPYSNDAVITRAASKNGLYEVSFTDVPQASSKTDAQWLSDTFGSSNPFVFGLKNESGLMSGLDIAFKQASGTQSITSYFMTDGNNTKINVTSTAPARPQEIVSGTSYTVSTDDDSFIYDAYLEFDQNDIDKWGIVYDKANSPLTFKTTIMPDALSAKEFTYTYHYLKKDGTSASQAITVTPKTNLNGATQLCSEVTHAIVNVNNFFTVSLDEMFNALGSSKTLQWVRDVDLVVNGLSNTKFTIKEGSTDKGVADFTASFAKNAAGDAANNASEAKFIKFEIANNAQHLTPGTSYVANITFGPKTGAQGEYAGNVINKVTVPFKLSIPAFTDLLQKDMNVFDEEGKVASAYMLEKLDVDGATATSTYKFQSAFTNLAANVKKGFSFNFELDNDPNNKIANDKTSAGLALLATNNYNSTAVAPLTVNTEDAAKGAAITLLNAERANAYGKELIVKITNPKWCGAYEYDATSFKIKLLSPIKEGSFEATGGAIKISATGTKSITAADIKGLTVKGIKYDLFKEPVYDATSDRYVATWKRQDIAKVEFSAPVGAKFTLDQSEPINPIFDANTGALTTPASITMRASASTGTDKLEITVTDIWGYKITKTVDVVVE